MSISFIRAGRSFAIASILGAGVLSGAVVSSNAQQPAATPASVGKPATPIATPEEAARSTLRSETRIRRLHDKLEIAAAQEALWAPVAQVMRDNEATFRTTLTERTSDMKSSTAVNDLKAFQVIADHHSAGLKKFIPVFETLYQSLPAAQQKRADRIFADRSRSDRM